MPHTRNSTETSMQWMLAVCAEARKEKHEEAEETENFSEMETLVGSGETERQQK